MISFEITNLSFFGRLSPSKSITLIVFLSLSNMFATSLKVCSSFIHFPLYSMNVLLISSFNLVLSRSFIDLKVSSVLQRMVVSIDL